MREAKPQENATSVLPRFVRALKFSDRGFPLTPSLVKMFWEVFLLTTTNDHLAGTAEHGAKRTKGLTVYLAQPKNRRFAGLGERGSI